MKNIEWICKNDRKNYNRFLDGLCGILPFNEYCVKVSKNECRKQKNCVLCQLIYLLKEREEI